INLEELSRRHILAFEDQMNEHYIGVKFKADRPNNSPIEIYANGGVFSALIGTLLSNCVNYAPDNSYVYHGVRIEKGNLKLLLENETDGREKRKIGGMGRGKGFPFVKSVVDN